mgnify:CR=1 FL=1
MTTVYVPPTLRDKRRQLADCYARLGLKPGRVWARALGKKAA